jgi:anti-anti-sigma regulatory factor
MSASQFRHLTISPDGDVLIIGLATPHLRGDELASELGSELLAAVGPSGARKVVLDFGRVADVSSRGFGAIAAFRQVFVRDQGGQVALCGLSPDVRDALALIRFIDSHGSAPMLDPSETGRAGPSGAARHRAAPLFDVVEADVPASVARLRAPGAGTG